MPKFDKTDALLNITMAIISSQNQPIYRPYFHLNGRLICPIFFSFLHQKNVKIDAIKRWSLKLGNCSKIHEIDHFASCNSDLLVAGYAITIVHIILNQWNGVPVYHAMTFEVACLWIVA